MLAQQGYQSFLCFAGFGSSSNPFAGSRPGPRSGSDARVALDYLAALPEINPQRIHLVGHSMGAGPVVNVGRYSEQAATLALLGPPRRVFEVATTPFVQQFLWDKAQLIHYRLYHENLSSRYSRDQWLQDFLNGDMVNVLPSFTGIRHKPILLVDGEKEDEYDKSFLRWYYHAMSWPKRLVTIRNTHHYFGVRQDDKTGLIFHDPATNQA